MNLEQPLEGIVEVVDRSALVTIATVNNAIRKQQTAFLFSEFLLNSGGLEDLRRVLEITHDLGYKEMIFLIQRQIEKHVKPTYHQIVYTIRCLFLVDCHGIESVGVKLMIGEEASPNVRETTRMFHGG